MGRQARQAGRGDAAAAVRGGPFDAPPLPRRALRDELVSRTRKPAVFIPLLLVAVGLTACVLAAGVGGLLRPGLLWVGLLLNGLLLFASVQWFAGVRRRRPSGTCVRCSYELRGLALDDRGCPECGLPVGVSWSSGHAPRWTVAADMPGWVMFFLSLLFMPILVMGLLMLA